MMGSAQLTGWGWGRGEFEDALHGRQILREKRQTSRAHLRGHSDPFGETRGGPLAEPASMSAPGWPHHQQQAHSTADVWLVVWSGLLVGFFCPERLLKSESGFSLSLGHESLLLGLERGWRDRRPHARSVFCLSPSGPSDSKAHIWARLPVKTC